MQRKLGKWTFISKRYGKCYEGHMFPLLVKEQLDDLWPEKNVRRRIWVWFCSIIFILFLQYIRFFY